MVRAGESGVLGMFSEVPAVKITTAVSLTARPGNGVELNSTLVEAIQVLVNRVVNPRADGRKWVNLDVGGFREEGDPAQPYENWIQTRYEAKARREGRGSAYLRFRRTV